MHGSISVNSMPKKGTTFTIRLPLEKAEGKNDDPDISGLTVYALTAGDSDHDIITSYMGYAGVAIRFAENATGLVQKISAESGNCLVLLGLPTQAENKQVVNLVLQQVSRPVSFLQLTDNLADDLECNKLANCHCYAIQKYPIIPSELINALAVLSGRLSMNSTLNNESADVDLDSAHEHPFHVLLVEDNEVNQQVLAAQLESLDFTVEIAENGAVALEKWEQGAFDLILTDCQMPEMDGFEMTEKLRQLEKAQNLSHIPVIAITANALKGEAERCLAAGMDSYLSKPIEMAQLKKTLEQWTARSSR